MCILLEFWFLMIYEKCTIDLQNKKLPNLKTVGEVIQTIYPIFCQK